MLVHRVVHHFRDPYNCAKLGVLIGLSCFFLFLALPAALTMWEVSNTIGTFEVDPPMQATIVESLAESIDKHYLDAEKAAEMAAGLRQARRDGEFLNVSSPSEFARTLTANLFSSSGDKHIRVLFKPEQVEDMQFHNFPPPRKERESGFGWLVDRLGRYQANFGIEKVEISKQGIGYLRLDGFFRPYLAGEKFAAVMDKLASSKALIIDLRNNGGGNRQSVALLASYFFDKATHLSDVVAPRTGERQQMWTSEKIEGKRYGQERPVYILTSHHTFSGAEDFAYAMQKLNRATVVGEVTAGGAHPIAPARLSAHFIVLVPVAESISPVTHSNWEGIGVQPDKSANSHDALKLATDLIQRKWNVGSN